MEHGNRILNSAQDLFFNCGIKNVTMDDIANKVQMSKKTLYQFHASKKDLVEAITKKFLTNHEQEYELLTAKSKDAIDELLMLIENLHDIFEQFNPRMIFDLQCYYPEVWQVFKERKNSFMLNKIIANLNRGKREGLFRKNIHGEISARMQLEQIQISMNPEIFPPDKFTIKEIHTQLLVQYLHGITTLKGHKLINKYMNMSGSQAKSN